MACWADEDDVICIHPGGPRLVGLGAIRAAFDAVFNSGSIRIQVEAVRKIESMTSAVHSAREGPAEAFTLATNVYHKTAQGWRMVAHHASPGATRETEDISETPHILH